MWIRSTVNVAPRYSMGSVATVASLVTTRLESISVEKPRDKRNWDASVWAVMIGERRYPQMPGGFGAREIRFRLQLRRCSTRSTQGSIPAKADGPNSPRMRDRPKNHVAPAQTGYFAYLRSSRKKMTP
jgi:hypothetical protein